jgi:3-hydroxy-9,10-secoandrosta-1,3,5(10)-triene-9,17-dione monooxygenase reductase component
MSNPDERAFREVLGHFATGITIVTAQEEGRPVGFTCQSFTALSLEPPMIAIAPAKSSSSWPKMVQAGSFCINILAESQEQLCKSFAVSGGDKFVGVKWHIGAGGSPILDGSLAVIECELHSIYDAGDHELVTGRVTSLSQGEGHPLLFYKSKFTGVVK